MIPFNKPSVEGDETGNILEAIDRGKIGGNGHFTKLCQELIEQTIGATKILLTSSCTDALEMCALLCDIQPGDEVIMPSFTFVSTANAFCLRGAKPVFVDINADDLNINADLIEEVISEKTKAIVPVHYAGVSCDMNKIVNIAEKYNIDVIEDAAQAYLATSNGQYLGTIGRFGCFSFHETKSFICGEGGALAIKHEEDVSESEIVWEKGTNRAAFFRGEARKYTWVGLGSSFLPNELTAAFLYGQLAIQHQILLKRKAIFEYYDHRLKPLADEGVIRAPFVPKHVSGNYHMYHILVENNEIRDKLLSYLWNSEIYAVFHYVPLHNSPYARKLNINATLPITEDIADRLIRLPFFNSITREEQEHVIGKLYRFFEHESESSSA